VKQITNFRNATVFDTENDSLLDDVTKMHILSYQMQGMGSPKSIPGESSDRVKKFLQYHIDNGIPVVAHNGIGYDIPVMEKLLGIDLSELMVIDSLALSYYLNTDRKMHGLGSFEEEYGTAKVKVLQEEWIGLTEEELLRVDSDPELKRRKEKHYSLMKERCEDDVKINKSLWEDLKDRLISMYSQVKELVDNYEIGGKRIDQEEILYIDRYIGNSTVDEYVDRILTFLNYKLDCAALQEKTMWEVDVDSMRSLQEKLSDHLYEAKVSLESIMDEVPSYSPKKRPKKPYKNNGELSASGKSWRDAMSNLDKKDNLGHPLTKLVEGKPDEIKVLKSYKPPNVGSSVQIKNLLFSHGWEPESFKYIKNDEEFQAWVDGGFKKGEKPVPRKVPQVNIDGEDGKEFCPSVRRLIEETPEIADYEKYTTIKHRSDMLKGWEENLYGGKYLRASIGGFSNTLRVKHRGLVNIPGTHKPYGEEIRGLLIAGKGKTLLGSDLSSLEDRIKQHFMLAFDPEYVATMLEDGYDPHLDIAVAAGLITEFEVEEHKQGRETAATKAARRVGKQGNYSAQYGAKGETVSRAAGVTLKVGKAVVDGYLRRNWSIQAIADDQTVITCKEGKKWLVNPINGFLYSLRTEKDRFSTLCQGTGSFMFDIWVDNMLEGMKKEFGVKRLSGSFHDEFINGFKDTKTNKDKMEKITLDAIKKVNEEFLLRRELGADIQFGTKYSEIH